MCDLTKSEKTKTLGGYRVGISFNPSKDSIVNEIKDKTAELITLLEHFRIEENSKTKKDQEIQRLSSLAQTHYENAAMWAVKCTTKHLVEK